MLPPLVHPADVITRIQGIRPQPLPGLGLRLLHRQAQDLGHRLDGEIPLPIWPVAIGLNAETLSECRPEGITYVVRSIFEHVLEGGSVEQVAGLPWGSVGMAFRFPCRHTGASWPPNRTRSPSASSSTSTLPALSLASTSPAGAALPWARKRTIQWPDGLRSRASRLNRELSLARMPSTVRR